jgi:hypothetical protein
MAENRGHEKSLLKTNLRLLPVHALSSNFSLVKRLLSLRKPLQGFSSGFSRSTLAILMALAASEVSKDTCSRFAPTRVCDRMVT